MSFGVILRISDTPPLIRDDLSLDTEMVVDYAPPSPQKNKRRQKSKFSQPPHFVHFDLFPDIPLALLQILSHPQCSSERTS